MRLIRRKSSEARVNPREGEAPSSPSSTTDKRGAARPDAEVDPLASRAGKELATNNELGPRSDKPAERLIEHSISADDGKVEHELPHPFSNEEEWVVFQSLRKSAELSRSLGGYTRRVRSRAPRL
jgi:hypothetical protein